VSEGVSYQRTLKRFLNRTDVNLGLGIVVLLSVTLLLIEYFLTLEANTLAQIHIVQDLIVGILMLDLLLRWIVSSSTVAFLKLHWLEILAILPLFRVFRLGRLFILLRLLQLFALGAIFRRKFGRLQHIFDSRWPEYGLLAGFTCFALIFGTLGLAEFETGLGIQTHEEAFWKALFSLLSGEYAEYPESLGGKLVVLVLFVFGMGIFAMLTGTVSAFMLERLKEDDMKIVQDGEQLKNHIVVCGHSAKTAILLQELLAEPENQKRDIILVSALVQNEEIKNLGISDERLMFVPQDFTHIDVLKKAGIMGARTAIILSEAAGSRSSHDVDARTIMAALTIEKLNPGIHTVAELNHSEYMSHLKMGGVDDVVLQGEVSSRLLFRAGMSKGVLPFFEDLLSNGSGNALAFKPLPSEFVGKVFQTTLNQLYPIMGGPIVGVRSPGKQLEINPGSRPFAFGDEVLVILPWKQA